jgi:hypothetical protein
MLPLLKKYHLAGIVLVGLIFTTIDAFIAYDQKSVSGKSLPAKAVVIDNYCTYSTIGKKYDYFPIFQFVDIRTGQNVTAQGIIGNGDAPAYLIGQGVDVLYNPENPSVGVTATNSIWAVWFNSITSLTVGLGLTIAGILIFMRGKAGNARRQ